MPLARNATASQSPTQVTHYERHRPEQTLLYRLVAFSCKKRGFCPSCGARRMTESSALLVDEVFPEVPIRQLLPRMA